ncbi:MAG: GNAT family N-acetyltransferase [Alphaproteobacteria bacterium]|nr:GNAT family N-acetyltransferase [Alphaproteobacteria bacterium]
MRNRLDDKAITAAQAALLIRPGDRVFVGTACATPQSLTHALEARDPAPADVALFHFLTTGALPEGAARSRYRHRTFFVGSDMRELARDGVAEYVPISLAQVPRLVANGRLAADVALIQVSPPDDFGYVSLGVSVDVTAAVVETARLVIAEINPNMPCTMGDSFLHVDRLDHVVMVDRPVLEYAHAPLDEVGERIARYIAGIIDDGSTLQVGLGRIPNEMLKYLVDRRDLGFHSDVVTDAIVELIERGLLTGRLKSHHRGKVVASYAVGTKRLYDLLHKNPMFSFHPIDHVCDPRVIAGHDRMVSVTQAFAVDLTGQVCSDQFEGEFYGGVGAQPDFLRGAARSVGGKPIICLRSTTDDGTASRIRALLKAGEGVTVARSDVHYVVTEFGIAHLFGKSIRERALALIEIAHPDFRAELLDEAKRLNYLPAEHKLVNMRAYAVEEERVVTTRDGRRLMIRPARASDIGAVQEIFYKMSQDDVYTRFFRRLPALSYGEAQRLANVDQDTECAFVAVEGGRENEKVAASSCYFLNQSTNMAEVAYMVNPGWQSTGLGSLLQAYMIEHAKKRAIRGFVAEILVGNSKMIALAKKACDNVSVHREGGTCEVSMLFD